MGMEASGWDPAFFPTESKRPAQVVNLGFVLNVIGKPAERVSVVREAWALANRAFQGFLKSKLPKAVEIGKFGHL